jgi:hypothetical protein
MMNEPLKGGDMKSNQSREMPSVEYIQYLNYITSDAAQPIIKDAERDPGPFYPSTPTIVSGTIYIYPGIPDSRPMPT